MKNKKTCLKKSSVNLLAMIMITTMFIFHVDLTLGLDVDFYDNWGFGGGVTTSPLSIGSVIDKISWVEDDCPLVALDDQWVTLGVINEVYDVGAYCVNTDKEDDNGYDLCLIKNSYWETSCNDITFPAPDLTESESASDWAEADNVPQWGSTPICDDEDGNTYISSSSQKKRGQIKYYGASFTNEEIYDTGGITLNSISVNELRQGAVRFQVDDDMILETIDVYVRNRGGSETVSLHLRSNLTGSNLATTSFSSSNFPSSAGWYEIDFTDTTINSSTDYYVLMECDTCSWFDPIESDQWYECDKTTPEPDCGNYDGWISTDNGVSWSEWSSNREPSLRVTGTEICKELGTTSDSSSYDYYYIDEMETVCVSDGSSDYRINGDYGAGTINIESSVGCFNHGSGLICDTDHDNTVSSSPTTLPTHPCKKDTGIACTDSSECWNDEPCTGAGYEYYGICDGTLLDIYRKEWSDGCTVGVLIDAGTLNLDDKNCTSDGGFPPNYICDSAFEEIDRTTAVQVYNDICKGWIGVSCTVDADCHSLLVCNGGFCDTQVFATYTHSPDTNNINKTNTVTFDNELSFSSGDDIQIACWSIDGSNDECDGNSTFCSSNCNGASFDSPNWDDGFTNTFNNGGNFEVLLTIETGLDADNYSETFCVSGDGTACFSCYDDILNDDETYVDWGGHCGTPYFAFCNNNVLNNATGETSIDYGGDCGSCDNTSALLDEEWIFLKSSTVIKYPFDNSQCEDSVAIKSGVVFFIFLVSSVLLIALIVVIIILLVLLFIFGFNVFGLFLIFGRRTRKGVVNIFNKMVNNKK